MDLQTTAQRLAGFRMPAEWARHEATWLAWPHCQDTWPGADLTEAAEPAYVAMVEALRHGETVNIAVAQARMEAVRARLGAAGIATGEGTTVHLRRVPTDDEWIRDYGAIFVTNGEARIATDWTFNAWGGKYDRTEQNNTVPRAMAQIHGAERVVCPVVMEGGSIDVNGQGLALTTESCLLNPNRNPDLSRDDIEAWLHAGLGIDELIWLGDGIAGDDTDGHIDDMTRFVGERTVVTAIEDDPSDVNHAPLAENRARLRAWRGRDGRGLDVVTLPMPAPLFHATGAGETERLPASYANFLIGNAAVLLPVFGDRRDAEAIETMQRLFPSRRVAPIPARDLVWGLGACHCLSQQVPAV